MSDSGAGLMPGANAWHLLCRFKKVHGLWQGSEMGWVVWLPKYRLIISSIPCHQGEGDQGLDKDPPRRPLVYEGSSLQPASLLAALAVHHSPETVALMELRLSVFKATPTLWQPMAAATPDSLPATAISSQVSSLPSWALGNLGGGV